MVGGNRVTVTVHGQQRTTTGWTVREHRHRIAQLEAENEWLTRELARKERERQAIIEHYERVVRSVKRSSERTNHVSTTAQETGIVERVRKLL